MSSFINRLLVRPERRVVLVPRDVCRLRLHEWRASPDLVAQARKLMAMPELRALLDVVRAESTANMQLTGIGLEERAIWQARTEGYAMALNNLEAMASYAATNEPVEVSYADPETETEPELNH